MHACNPVSVVTRSNMPLASAALPPLLQPGAPSSPCPREPRSAAPSPPVPAAHPRPGVQAPPSEVPAVVCSAERSPRPVAASSHHGQHGPQQGGCGHGSAAVTWAGKCAAAAALCVRLQRPRHRAAYAYAHPDLKRFNGLGVLLHTVYGAAQDRLDGKGWPAGRLQLCQVIEA
jgi:hypothetical protein